MGLELSAAAHAGFADEQALSELASHPELLRGLIAHLNDGLAVSDGRGKCVFVNRALCEMTGFSAAESLEASEQRWRSIAENPFELVIIIGRDYKYRFINRVTRSCRCLRAASPR